jgi:hypothetical protein
MYGFKAGKSWWLVKSTTKSAKHHENAIPITDQLGLSDKDMENVYSARWVGNIGSSLYTEYLRQGKVGRTTPKLTTLH